MKERVPRRPSRSLALLLLLGACAGSPSAPQQADLEARRFDPPAPGRAAIYVYRSGLMGMMRPLDVSLPGRATAQLGYNTFIRIDGPPGAVDIACTVGDRTARAQVQMPDGETRFVEVSMAAGLLTPSCGIAEVPADRGRAAVRSARRVEAQ
jgi:hypothetical protein